MENKIKIIYCFKTSLSLSYTFRRNFQSDPESYSGTFGFELLSNHKIIIKNGFNTNL